MLSQTPLGELLATPSAVELEGIGNCLVDVADSERLRRLGRRDPGRWAEATLQDFVRWGEWHRHHAQDPRHALDVIVTPSSVPMAWDRWAHWDAVTPDGPPRWSTRRAVRLMTPHGNWSGGSTSNSANSTAARCPFGRAGLHSVEAPIGPTGVVVSGAIRSARSVAPRVLRTVADRQLCRARSVPVDRDDRDQTRDCDHRSRKKSHHEVFFLVIDRGGCLV